MSLFFTACKLSTSNDIRRRFQAPARPETCIFARVHACQNFLRPRRARPRERAGSASRRSPCCSPPCPCSAAGRRPVRVRLPSAIEKAGGDGQVAPVNDPLPASARRARHRRGGRPRRGGVRAVGRARHRRRVARHVVETGADGRASIRLLGEHARPADDHRVGLGSPGLAGHLHRHGHRRAHPHARHRHAALARGRSGVAFAAQPVIQLKDGAGMRHGQERRDGHRRARPAPRHARRRSSPRPPTRGRRELHRSRRHRRRRRATRSPSPRPDYVQVTSAPIAIGTPCSP